MTPFALCRPSIVSYLLERNARYLMLGSIHYITFVHYLEHELRSSQRMFKQFTGKVMTRARGSWEHDGASFSCPWLWSLPYP